jgi:CubicO group peptidase (beta-lactamase class C family)
MKDTWVYDRPRVRTHDPAIGYARSKKGGYDEVYGAPPYRNEYWVICGGHGVWSSAADMARWDAAWREGRLVKADTLRQAVTPSKTRDGKTNEYGFGWGLGHDSKGELLWMAHSGGGPSFHSNTYRNLAEGRTITVLTNLYDCDIAAIRDGIERVCRARKVQEK